MISFAELQQAFCVDGPPRAPRLSAQERRARHDAGAPLWLVVIADPKSRVRLRVRARSASEARARVKAELKLGRLPVGSVASRLKAKN